MATPKDKDAAEDTILLEEKYKKDVDFVKAQMDVFCQLEMHQNDKKNAAPKQSNFVNIRYEFLSYFHQGVL